MQVSVKKWCAVTAVSWIRRREEWSISTAAMRFGFGLQIFSTKIKQIAQLSQRDRAAGCISFGQKWKTGTGRQYFTNIIGLSSTTVTKSACKALEYGKKTHNKGYYVVQGHSKSSRSVLIDFLLVINSKWRPPRTVSELSQFIVQILDTLRFWSTLWGRA